MIRIRPTEAGDLEALSRLFDDRFGRPFSAEEWMWKYDRLPGEARSWVAIDRSGAPLAHAGALCLPARVDARLGEAPDGSGAPRDRGIWQLTDWAGTTARTGLRPPLIELGRRLLDDLPRPGDAPWIFGFPSERHFRLGRRAFGYRPMPRITPLTGAIPASPGTIADGLDPLVEIAEHCGDWPEAAEAAWETCGVVGVRRSAEFLNWRYHARPGRYYRFYRLRAGLRHGLREDGMAVFAFVGREARAAELWLPLPGEIESGDPGGAWEPALRAVAADLARAGIERWTFWPPPADVTGPLSALLGRLGLRPGAEGILMGYRGASAPDPRFYYAMGDYDVV